MSHLITYLAATALASSALVAAATLPATAAGHDDHPRYEQRSSVVLGSIQYDSPGWDNRSNRSLNAEWVTVTNTGRYAVNLGGWTLTDADHHTYRFDHLRLVGRQSVRVHTGTGRDTDHDLYQDRRAYVWNNDTDTATLRDDRGHTIDVTSWGRQGGGHHH
ncbi:lamin tail domain-containing protein [Actinacidiphila soli]|uniref:lamin tail domain-containing protein n=1 Tax=Actinacidiphila soli TaxID=2487275 RepID=UPI000FCB29C8|nr:lamin tail domain-containing protein [Actinacidiphila soli]